MYVQVADQLEQLQALQERWDKLAASVVFRRLTWLSTWWRHYGDVGSRRLHVLLVWDGNEPAPCKTKNLKEAEKNHSTDLLGILPCYVENSLALGKVLRLLGDGEVCSDHLDLLTSGMNARRVAEAVAEYLTQSSGDWDLIDMPALDASRDDCKMRTLFEELSKRNCQVSRTPDVNSWSIELPESWENFLALQSKSHRKQLRRLQKRVLDTEVCRWHQVKLVEEFDRAWEIFIDLHQRRRQSLGERGCFGSPRWGAFHEDVARQLLQRGELRLSWLELGGRPVAVEYNLAGGRTTYAYQGGLDPDQLDEEPGRLSLIRTIQQAIAEGHRKFDLLRGDEPYKSHWRATAKETVRIRVVPNRVAAQLRHQTWSSFRGAARWVRQITHLFN